LKFVFIWLGRHVARLGFICLLGAILVRGLFLPLFVQNDTVSLCFGMANSFENTNA
jgi:hypothetical protein